MKMGVMNMRPTSDDKPGQNRSSHVLLKINVLFVCFTQKHCAPCCAGHSVVCCYKRIFEFAAAVRILS